MNAVLYRYVKLYLGYIMAVFTYRPYLFVSQRTFAGRSIANRFKTIKTLTNACNLYIHGMENIALSYMKVNAE